MDEINVTRLGRVDVITLYRPHAGNRITQKLGEQLVHALSQARHDPHVSGCVLTGHGDVFCLGGDYRGAGPTTAARMEFARAHIDLFSEMAQLGKPLVGAINGNAHAGGFSLVVACDLAFIAWEWEVRVPELGISVFIIPGSQVKNGDERLVVLNAVARSVIEARRGHGGTHVFTCKGKPVSRMMTSAWKRARIRVGLAQVRVHDLKHTFGRRLRAAGVSFEDRQDLLGHRSGRITTHYSAAELTRLVAAAESIADRNGEKPELVVLKGALQGTSRETPASALKVLGGTA